MIYLVNKKKIRFDWTRVMTSFIATSILLSILITLLLDCVFLLSLWTEPFKPFPRVFLVVLDISSPILVYCTAIANIGIMKNTKVLISVMGTPSGWDIIPQNAVS